MKKYIIPAVEVTMLAERSAILQDSFTVVVDPDVTVGGNTTDEGEDLGQLTQRYGWDADDWND